MIARSQPSIALALLAVLSLGATFLGAAAEEFQWQGYLESGRSLEIKGINGKVSAHPARDREVGIVAVKKGKDAILVK